MPARWWTELFALSIATGAHLIVGATLLGILEHLVGLIDALEFLLGTRVLVLVRVVLARQLAISRFDLGLGRIRLYAKNVVIVFEFHLPIPEYANPRRMIIRRGESYNQPRLNGRC